MLLKIMGNPLMQIFSFCIILTGSAYFGGPYIYFLYHAVQEMVSYAVFGWLGIGITVSALFFSNRGEAVLQFIGLLVMFVSLLMLVFSSDHFMSIYAWRELVPVLTLLFFISVTVVVVRKFIKAGGL